jgi:hypothetical protein
MAMYEEIEEFFDKLEERFCEFQRRFSQPLNQEQTNQRNVSSPRPNSTEHVLSNPVQRSLSRGSKKTKENWFEKKSLGQHTRRKRRVGCTENHGPPPPIHCIIEPIVEDMSWIQKLLRLLTLKASLQGHS